MNKSDLCERYLSWFWCRACSIHRGFSCSDALLPRPVPYQRVLHHRESSGGQDFLHSLKAAFSLNPGSVGAILVGWGSSLGDSCILHVLTVSRHCHPGWSKNKEKTMTSDSHIFYHLTGGNSPCCGFWHFSNPLLWLSRPLQHPEPPSRWPSWSLAKFNLVCWKIEI